MKFMSKISIESDWTSAQRLTTVKNRQSLTYYSNHDASYKLLISGYIKLNPGPNSDKRVGNLGDANVRAPKCNIYYKTVPTNYKRLMCEHCKILVHLNCTNVNLKIENSKIARTWSCHPCTLIELPLYNQDLHGQRIEIRHHHPIRNMIKEQQTSFRISC